MGIIDESPQMFHERYSALATSRIKMAQMISGRHPRSLSADGSGRV
jgi:hypothetical protein